MSTILGFKELSTLPSGRKLVELTFAAPGYPVGDGSHRKTDVWELSADADVADEVARFEVETYGKLGTGSDNAFRQEVEAAEKKRAAAAKK